MGTRRRAALGLFLIAGIVLATSPGAFMCPPAKAVAGPSCAPTRSDALGPFYKPNAPVRASVGSGHVLAGAVRSITGCTPIAGARVEFWLAGPNGQYDDDHRATITTDAGGRYGFASNFPPPYSGRPPHIHVRVTADRHQTLVTQYYPSPGETQGTFDLVLTR